MLFIVLIMIILTSFTITEVLHHIIGTCQDASLVKNNAATSTGLGDEPSISCKAVIRGPGDRPQKNNHFKQFTVAYQLALSPLHGDHDQQNQLAVRTSATSRKHNTNTNVLRQPFHTSGDHKVCKFYGTFAEPDNWRPVVNDTVSAASTSGYNTGTSSNTEISNLTVEGTTQYFDEDKIPPFTTTNISKSPKYPVSSTL